MNKTLSTREVADKLEMHINTIYRYISKGVLPAHKLGGNGHSRRHWRVKASDLESFVQGVEPVHEVPSKIEESEQLADSAPNL